MKIPVLCTCGKSIATYYNAFKKIRDEENNKTMKSYGQYITPKMIFTAEELRPKLDKYLDDMNITRECCRQLFISNIDFNNKFN
jgi:DNA-directed RNA polymerase subunit N (RpoN/RPB10)